MCWNNNKQSKIATVMIISSLMLFTLFDQTAYSSIVFNIAGILQVTGILLMLHNMFIRKSCSVQPKKTKQR